MPDNIRNEVVKAVINDTDVTMGVKGNWNVNVGNPILASSGITYSTIEVLEDATGVAVTDVSSLGGAAVPTALTKGQIIRGRFTAVAVTAGTLRAYAL